MQKVSKDAIDKLLKNSSRTKVTLYFPVHTSDAISLLNEDKIRFKNLIRKTQDLLNNSKNESNQSAKIIGNLENLLDDNEFWRSHSSGVGISAGSDRTDYINLPFDIDEYVAVDESFHIAPLMVINHENSPYYLLVLAQQEPKIFTGDLYGVQETGIELPHNIVDALLIDEMSQRPRRSQGGGSTGTGQHGGRAVKDSGDEERLKFFRKIDDKLNSHLDTSLPLLLAGVDNEIAEFSSISKYPIILEEKLSGNHTVNDVKELHSQCIPLLRGRILTQKRNRVSEIYRELKSQNKSVSDPKTLEDAAETGRIDTLILGIMNKTRDSVKAGLYEVEKLIITNKYSQLPIEHTAAKVWQSGGNVIAVNQNDVPDGGIMAAILRY